MSTRADIEANLAKAEADLAKAATNFAKACADAAETKVCLPKAFSNLTKVKVDLAKADADLANARASCRRARIELARLNRVAGMPIGYRSEPTDIAYEAGYRSEPTDIAYEAALEAAHTNRRKANENRRKARSALTRAQATERMTEADRRKASDDRRLARPGLANRNHAEMIAKSDGWTDKLLKGAIISPKLGTTASPSDWDAKLRSTQSKEHLVRAVEKPATRQPRLQKESLRLTGRFSGQEVSFKDTGAWRSLAWQTVELSSLTLAYLLYYYIDVNLQIVMLPPSVSSLLVG